MLKIAHVQDVKGLELPDEVIAVIEETATILDEEYGDDRNVDRGDGGFIVVIEERDELKKLNEFHLDVTTAIPEYVNEIPCSDSQVFVSVLVLLSDDFGVLAILPLHLLQYTNWQVGEKNTKT